MASINALTGRNLSSSEQQALMAQKLRGEQADGDYMSLSTIQPVAKLGQGLRKRALLGAGNIGKINTATTLNNRSVQAKTVEDQRKVEAKTVENHRKVEAKTVEDHRKVEAKTVGNNRLKKSAKLLATARAGESVTRHMFDPSNGYAPISLRQLRNGDYETLSGEPVPKGERLDNLIDAEGVGLVKGGGKKSNWKPNKLNQSIPVIDLKGDKYSIYQDPNKENRWFRDGERNEDGSPIEVKRNQYTKRRVLTSLERTNLGKDREGLTATSRLLGSIPQEAFVNTAHGQAHTLLTNPVKAYMGKLFPSLGDTAVSSAIGAEFWRNKEAFVDMAKRNSMFGSALTRQEIERWADANISSKNSLAQGIQAMQDLVQLAREKSLMKTDAYKASGVDNGQLSPFALGFEETEALRGNIKLRKEGVDGIDYNTLRRDATLGGITVTQYADVIKNGIGDRDIANIRENAKRSSVSPAKYIKVLIDVRAEREKARREAEHEQYLQSVNGTVDASTIGATQR